MVGALGSLVALPVQAALGTGQGLGSLFDDGVLTEVAADGVGLGVALALVGLVVAVSMVDRHGPVALAGAVVAAGSFAASGHTRAGSSVALATVADVSHLLVVAVWGAGGSSSSPSASGPDATPPPRPRPRRSALVGRFSTLATAAIVLVGLTGGALAWREVGSLDALTDTGYGRLLLVKVAVVAVIAWLGRLQPLPAGARPHERQGAGRPRPAAHARCGSRSLALAVVIGLTSVLVVVTPGAQRRREGSSRRSWRSGTSGTVQVTVSPAQAGFNQIHLYLFDPDGRPADIAESITLQLSLPSAQLGPIERDAVRAGPAHFQLDGDDLAVAGTWTIEIQARLDRFTEATGIVEVPVAS